MPIVIIIIIIMFLIMITLICVSENSPITAGVCCLIALPFIIWAIIAGQIDFSNYESKTYQVLENDNIQYIIVDKVFININETFKQYVKPNQVVEVTNPVSKWAGGIYWVAVYTKYKIINKEQDEN